MKVRAVGAAALGPDTQMQQALIGGAQEMMVGSTATLVGITKEMALWDTPFLINNAKEADALLDGPIGQKVMDKLQGQGSGGPGLLGERLPQPDQQQAPVTKLEDLGGIKLRVMQNNVYLDSFKTAGRQRHSAAVLRALQRAGDQDGGRPGEPLQHHPVEQVLRGAEVPQRDQPRLQPVDRAGQQEVVGWLSKAEQKVLMDAAKVSRDFERKDTREEAGKALADLKAKGMQINELLARRRGHPPACATS
jgi:TRAP-type C4-dicarboxylate transport system substrate-binding protein